MKKLLLGLMLVSALGVMGTSSAYVFTSVGWGRHFSSITPFGTTFGNGQPQMMTKSTYQSIDQMRKEESVSSKGENSEIAISKEIKQQIDNVVK